MLQSIRKKGRQVRQPDGSRCRMVVVGNPVKGELLLVDVKQGVHGLRVAVTRLPYRANRGQPVAMFGHRHRHPGCGLEFHQI